jgi:hypothetical protein
LRKTPIFFAENFAKIAENCDHNIDPRSAKLGWVYTFVTKNSEVVETTSKDSISGWQVEGDQIGRIFTYWASV